MIPIIVFSLVDKRVGFSNPEVVDSHPGSVKKNIFFSFFFFFFLNKLKMFWVQILPLPRPPHFFNSLHIVQYLFVHCTISSILGLQPP